MGCAVEFDDEFGGAAGEIGEVRADGVLALEPVTVKLLTLEFRPEDDLCFGHVLAHFPRPLAGAVFDLHAAAPSVSALRADPPTPAVGRRRKPSSRLPGCQFADYFSALPRTPLPI
jgi:hypothetical protein